MWMPNRFRTISAGPAISDPADELVPKGERRPSRLPGILAITADDRLYYVLLSASIDLGYRISWARTIDRAFELCLLQPMPIIVIDQSLPGVDWREVLPGISRFPDHPAVLLAAASEMNEEMWGSVLQLRGYDAVRRSAASTEWMRELRFALLSKDETQIASSF
jgi:hypothetical protein